MKFVDGDRYRNPSLRFSLTKPPDWQFNPTAWVPATRRLLAAKDEAAAERLAQARLPFVHLTHDHAEPEYALPTVQVVHRELCIQTASDRLRILEGILAMLAKTFRNFSVVDLAATDEFLGFPSVRGHYRFDIVRADNGAEFPCENRSRIVFRPADQFIIGMSWDSRRSDEDFDDLREIESSMKLVL